MKNNKKNLFTALLFINIFLMSTSTFATKRYWVGTGANKNWNATGNWAATSGGSSGSSVPGASDSVYYDGNGLGQCSINATVSVKRLEITPAYTDTLIQNAYTITVGTSGMVLSGGTFWGGSANITDQGIFTLSGCTFQSTSAILQIQNNYTFSSGTFSHNSGEVKYTATSTLNGNTTFYKLTFAPTANSTYTISSGVTLTVNNELKTTGASVLAINTGNIDAKGDVTISNTANSTASGGTGSITINGSGKQIFTGGTTKAYGRLCDVKINKSTDTLVLKNIISIAGNWTYTQGIIDAGTFNSTIAFVDWMYSGNRSISGSFSLKNLILNSASNGCFNSISTSDTIIVLGDLTIEGAGGVRILGGTIKLKGDLTNTNSSVNATSTGLVIMCGTSDQTITGPTTALQGRLCKLTINKPSGTLILKNIISFADAADWKLINGTVDATTYSSTVIFTRSDTHIQGKQTFYNLAFNCSAVTSRIYIGSTDTLIVNNDLKIEGTDPVLIYDGTINAKGDITITNTSTQYSGATANLNICGTGNQTLTGSGIANAGKLCNVNVNKPSGTLTLASIISLGNSWQYNTGTVSAGTSTVDFAASLNASCQGTSSTMDFNNVTVYSGTTTLTGNLSALGNLTINSGTTLNGNARNINVGGNWNLVGTFTPTNTTVTLNGGTQSISGGTIWNNLVLAGTGTKTALNMQTVNGLLTVNNGIILDMQTNQLIGTTITTSGTGILKTACTSSSNVPYNKNWSFTVEYTGTSTSSYVQPGNYSDLKVSGARGTSSITFPGTIGISGIFTNSATFSSGGFITTGNTINYNGTGAQTITAFDYNNLTISGTRTSNNVTLANAGTIAVSATFTYSPTFTTGVLMNDGSTIDFNGTGAQSIPAVNYNNLTLSGARTSNNITLASSGTIGIAGTLTKSATFTSGSIASTSSTISLNGNNTQTIPAFTFNNLSASGTGQKSITGNLTVNGTLTLTEGELALAGNTLSMSSNAYNAITQTNGYISTTGSGNLVRTTNTLSPYLFPIGYRTLNNAMDYFGTSITPGKTGTQQFTTLLNPDYTGILLSYDKTMYGSGTETIEMDIATSNYNTLHFEFDINDSANIDSIRVFDQNDNTLKALSTDYYSITGGNQLELPVINRLCLVYSKDIGNTDMNWTYEIDYDGKGFPVSEKIQYMDLLGRATQAQVRNVVDNTVLISQTVYDNYGRAALQTMAAPVGSVMQYQPNFITNASGTSFTYTDYDLPVNNNSVGELNNPSTVSNTAPGTLGWYYSNNNTLEPYQATTSYPYSRKELTSGGRNAAPGDEYRMGAGNESKGFSMVSGNELKFIFGTNKSFKSSISPTDKLVNSAITISGGIMASKSISIDADKNEVISYNVGGLTIASCYSGITTGACAMTSVANIMQYAGTSSTDIHLPLPCKGSGSNPSSLKLLLPGYDFAGRHDVDAADITFKITDLSTNKVLELGSSLDYTINATTRAVTFSSAYLTGSSVFRISFVYSPTLLNYLAANSITVPDADVSYDLDYSGWSVNYYDLSGHLRTSVSPKAISCSDPGNITAGSATTYDYSSLGQLIASKSPDEGLKEMTYDDEGKARFSQNAVQHAANKFSYTNYDAQGRAIESGENTSSNNGTNSAFFRNYYLAYAPPYSNNTPSSAIVNNIGDTGLRRGDCNDENYVYYYPLPANGSEDIPSDYTYKNSYSARYLMGKVCKTLNPQSATWYGYNQAGQTVFTVQKMYDGDYINYNSTTDSQIKTVDYTYDPYNGTLSDQTYQKNGASEKLKHLFTYDAALRLTRVDVSIAGATAVTQAKYYYSKTGVLKRKELGDKLQGIDYIYTVNGQLKSINHPSLDESKDPGQDGNTGSPNSTFGKDVFGLTLDYHENDYVRSGSNIQSSVSGATNDIFNGMIRAQRYKTRAITNSVNNGGDYIDYGGANQEQIISGTSDEIMNQYTYDEKYQLSKVVFGKFTSNNTTFTANANNCYKEWGTSGGIDYDANGNITSLKRNGNNVRDGILMDDFAYSYTGNTNQLASITDGASSSVYSNDFDAATSKAFTYNTIGQMIKSAAEGIANNNIEYNVRGLMKKVTYDNGNTAEYWYDDRGQKIKTEYYNGTVSKYTWYISDAGGNPLAIYEYDEAAGTPAFTLIEQPIYGSGRIGILDKVTGIINYEITDHLGNVRATIKGISTGVYELTSRTDYYAFGSPMPGRSYNLNNYRYNYQGQELAVGTNWQAFQLRMHNSDIGRFITVDPELQGASPYISMGNNPILMIDPTGGNFSGAALNLVKNIAIASVYLTAVATAVAVFYVIADYAAMPGLGLAAALVVLGPALYVANVSATWIHTWHW